MSTDMRDILVIYENVPESTYFFLLKVNNEDAKKIEACAGVFINSSDGWEETPAEWLSEFLKNKKKFDGKEPFSVSVETMIVHTGFLL